MRVLVVGYTMFDSDNRVRRYAETLARRGDAVEVVCLRPPGEAVEKQFNGIRIFRIQAREVNEKTKFDYFFRVCLFLVRSFLFISVRHFKKRYELVHVHSVPDFEVFAALIPKLFGAKVILDIHDIVPEFYESKFHAGSESLISKILKFVEKICCSFSDHVIISNHIWGERIVRRSVPQEKCSVILNYPDPVIFHRKRPKKKDKNFIMMYPGTIAWHQGIDIAVNAMAQIHETRKDIEFHIYGKGPEERNIIALISQLKLHDCVKVSGSIPLEEVVEKMIDCDLGIVPKRDDGFGGEAFSTKIFEFMALGIPVLIAETRIDKYYFNDSLVTFFKSDDENDLIEKILLIVDNPAFLKKQVENASLFIAENSWEKKKDEYLQLIERL